MNRFCAVLLCSIATQPLAAECADNLLSIKGDFGQVQFNVSVADAPEEREQGLMFVESMPRFDGMLFVFEEPGPVQFWMKNTLIPLDMIFAGEDGVVERIHADAIPEDLTPIPGGEDIKFVLEINGGLSALLGLSEGDVLQHPSIGETAIWPCEKNSSS